MPTHSFSQTGRRLGHHPSYAVAVFTRAPVPGKAKTRLIPLLGARGAAAFHAALTADTLRKVRALPGNLSYYVYLTGRRFPGLPARGPFTLTRQRGADLGERLQHAFRRLLRRHQGALVLGTDAPLLSRRVLRHALRELRAADAVLGPCPDGGYYLIALRRVYPGMFRGVRWGSGHAFRDTLRRLLSLGFVCSILETVPDVDRAADLRRLARQMARSRAARYLAPAAWHFLRGRIGAAEWGVQSRSWLIQPPPKTSSWS